MGKWKKKFRTLPKSIRVELQRIVVDDIKVLAGKRISTDDVVAGTYAHLGLKHETLQVGQSWEVVPPMNVGTTSKRNSEGWTVTRKDLPKHRKYFYRDIPIYGDAARNGWTTAAIPREVYETDSYPPCLFQIEVSVQEVLDDGRFGIVFSIDEVFSKHSASFEEDLLFAVNLLQENTGVSAVAASENPDFVFTSQLRWDVFPPGQIADLAMRIQQNGGRNPPDLATITERLELFEQFQPIEYLKGLGGNDHYIGAKYADDLVVFENMRHGNALYVLYGDWATLSQKPRSEILKLPTSKFDRLIHTEGWANRFALLMQHELQARGTRIRIGRHQRRRQR